MRQMLLFAAAAGSLALFSHGAAAEEAMVQVAQGEKFGPHLADADGQALYLFTADTQGSGGQEAQVSCTGECLEAWPPLYTSGEPQAGDKVEAGKLDTVEHNGQSMVTYNGWPLYYFAKDDGAGAPTGQDIESFGGEWYLVTPEGKRLHNE